MWTAATLKTSELLVAGKTSPTYEYYFTHPGRLTITDLLTFPLWKLLLKLLAAKLNIDIFYNRLDASTHFDELFLLFRGHGIPFLQRHSPEDEAVGRLLVTLWTNFAKDGRPTAELGDVKWLPREVANPSYLEIGEEHNSAMFNINPGTKGAFMRDLSNFTDTMEFFEALWAEVPPRMHLQRSPTWANPGMFGEVPYTAGNTSSYSSHVNSEL